MHAWVTNGVVGSPMCFYSAHELQQHPLLGPGSACPADASDELRVSSPYGMNNEGHLDVRGDRPVAAVADMQRARVCSSKQGRCHGGGHFQTGCGADVGGWSFSWASLSNAMRFLGSLAAVQLAASQSRVRLGTHDVSPCTGNDGGKAQARCDDEEVQHRDACAYHRRAYQ